MRYGKCQVTIDRDGYLVNPTVLAYTLSPILVTYCKDPWMRMQLYLLLEAGRITNVSIKSEYNSPYEQYINAPSGRSISIRIINAVGTELEISLLHMRGKGKENYRLWVWAMLGGGDLLGKEDVSPCLHEYITRALIKLKRLLFSQGR